MGLFVHSSNTCWKPTRYETLGLIWSLPAHILLMDHLYLPIGVVRAYIQQRIYVPCTEYGVVFSICSSVFWVAITRPMDCRSITESTRPQHTPCASALLSRFTWTAISKFSKPLYSLWLALNVFCVQIPDIPSDNRAYQNWSLIGERVPTTTVLFSELDRLHCKTMRFFKSFLTWKMYFHQNAASLID